ncbi:type II secretion system protein [Rheinheimera baltica]|uniref:PilW family protein n=1 Tax=Rheinheimera baltica TaxID=67576 RepID=UPI00273D6A29|nr:type II secretion system protein [Rheinheimera baltica]MDP5142601.1 type II secretion system protein [Rheinheimera baltica]
MRCRGFTLIELIVTMVLLGILATGVSSYLGFGARLYSDVAQREQILGQSRFVAERLVRELRNAAPNSVRLNELPGVISCLEFTPVEASGVYTTLPVYPVSDTEIHLQLFNWDSSLLNLPLIVYPTEANDYYGVSSHRVNLAATVQNAAAITDPANGASVELQLTAAHSFAADSPERRFYILATPVSYCASNGEIRRLVGHSFAAGFPSAGAGVLMAQQLRDAAFRVWEPVLNRNAVVNVFLQFGSDSSSDMFFNYEVHLTNVP